MYDGRMQDEVAAALSSLDASDPALAADARTGWDGLLSIAPTAGPTQSSVQTFCWLHLRSYPVDAEQRWDIASALADLLDTIGRPGYAAIARGDVTRSLLFADEARWQREYAAALDDAGIEPADTELVTWQLVATAPEQEIIDRIGETLEAASVVGDVDPRSLTDAVLRSDDADGVPLIERLLDYRIDLWSQYSDERAQMYAGLQDTLHDAATPAHGAVRRAQGFLELVGDGVTLTDAGYLPPHWVRDAVDTLWSHDEWPFPVVRELDTTPVATLKRLLITLRLVRKNRGRLVLTRRGRDVDPDRLWNILASQLIGPEYRPESIAAEVVLAQVARGRGPDPRDTELLETAATLVSAEGWTDAGLPATVDSVAPAVESVCADLRALGVFDRRESRPTPDGMLLAAALLRNRLLHTRLPASIAP